MADYIVTNAGTDAFNDTYTQNGTYNGKPCFQGNTNGMWLYYGLRGASSYYWALDSTKKSVFSPLDWAYFDATMGAGDTPTEGTYTRGTGSEPDAEVAAYVANKILTVNSHDGLTPSIAFDPTPDENGLESPQNCDFSLEYNADESVTLTAPASDPAGWEWVGWYIGGALQSANKVWNFTLSDDTIVVATYHVSGNGNGDENILPIQAVRRRRIDIHFLS